MHDATAVGEGDSLDGAQEDFDQGDGCLRIEQGEGRVVYCFSVDGKLIHNFAAVSRIGRSESGELTGYQRPEVAKHIQSIRAYSVKDEIRMRIIHPLTNKDLYAAYGKKAGGGILLYGPPGCGKTLLARATAGEVKVKFIAVGINDILDMWIGSSERNLHGVFASARSNRPCVLFFDEVDALAASRRDLRQSAGRQVINQFLSELDGVDGNNEDVLVMAATNAPWHLDSAFRRPGRFDRIIFVPPPDQPARAAILSVLLKGKPAAEVDVSAVAKKTPDFSGADLQAVVERAVEEKLTEAMKSNRLEPLTTKSMLAAASRVKPSTKEWFTTARNHALYANENGLYDPILEYMNIK